MADIPRPRWLYVDTYTVPKATGVVSSDAIGYGITSSSAIRRELAGRGIEIVTLDDTASSPDGLDRSDGARWSASAYAAVLSAVERVEPDLIFFFHVFAVFPAVVRKLLLDIGRNIPMVGYTHGSHWDPTDLHRAERYPGLELADLANLHALDRLLVVSQYMRATLLHNIGLLNPDVAADLDGRTCVVGLPLDFESINHHRTAVGYSRPTITFNHSPSAAKRPDVFLEVAARIIADHEVNVLVTRRFRSGDPGHARLSDIARAHPDQVILGNDMSVPDYYRALWKSDVQVSTASHESLGVATLEAMATGNCCLLPAIGAYPEVVHGDQDVLYGSTAAELGARLTHLLRHDDERKRIARRLQVVAAEYEPAHVVDRILTAVEGLRCGWRS